MSMDKKEIALSIGGVLATMALSYLLYRIQQKDSAANAAASQAAAAAAEQNAVAEQSQEEQYTSELPDLSGGDSDSSTSSTNFDTSSQTASSGSDASTSSDDSVADILAAWLASNPVSQPDSVASQLIPTAPNNLNPNAGITGIPTTAAGASAGLPSPTTNPSSPGSGPIASPVTASPQAPPVTNKHISANMDMPVNTTNQHQQLSE